MLTKTQINKINKSKKLNKGVDIKISKSQIRKVVQHGGSLWSSLAGLSSRILPIALPLVKKAAAPLSMGALSALGSLGVNKLFGKGFHITDQKVKQSIKYKDHLRVNAHKNEATNGQSQIFLFVYILLIEF